MRTDLFVHIVLVGGSGANWGHNFIFIITYLLYPSAISQDSCTVAYLLLLLVYWQSFFLLASWFAI